MPKVKYQIIDHIVILVFPNRAYAQSFISDVQTKNLLKKIKLDRRISERLGS